MKQKGVSTNRRGFLKGAAIVGGAAAVSTLSQGVTADTQIVEKPANAADDEPKGYRMTPHIREYYEKARF
jgi:nitrous oxide reductase